MFFSKWSMSVIGKILKTTSILVTLMCLQGCSTLFSLYDSIDPIHPATYGGTRRNINLWGRKNRYIATWISNTTTVIDFPFSLALDTLVLPITVPVDLYHGEEYYEQFKDVYYY